MGADVPDREIEDDTGRAWVSPVRVDANRGARRFTASRLGMRAAFLARDVTRARST